MRGGWALIFLCALAALIQLLPTANAGPYLEDDDGVMEPDDYSENAIDQLLQNAQKRACIRRGGNCDQRPNDCCYSSSCRCNLWGGNCRCQRMGLLQKWGKK